MVGSAVLVALNGVGTGSVVEGQVTRICAHLVEDGHDVLRAGTDDDALALVGSRADLSAAIVGWDAGAEGVFRALLARFTKLPVFLVTSDRRWTICRCGCRKWCVDMCGCWRTHRISSPAG